MANHALPTTTDTYVNVLSLLHARIDDVAKGFNTLTISPTNAPIGAIRWNDTSKKWETALTANWATFQDLSAYYNININGTVGATTASTGSFTTITTSGIASLGASSTTGGNAIVHVGNAAQSLTGQITFSNATAPIIVAKIGPTSLLQHTLPAVTSDTVVLVAASQNLTNKTLTASALSGVFTGNVTLSGQVSFTEATAPIISAKIGPSSTQQHTLPVVTSDTIVLLAATQALTNKTLTSPTISGATITGSTLTTGAFNGTLGATTPSTAAVTTLTASSTVTLSPASANVLIQPTGTGTVTIGPATAGTIDAMAVGSTTRSTGAFTTLTANSTVTLSPASANVLLQPTGTGVVTIGPATLGTINNMSVGATTPSTGTFTTLSVSSTVSGAGITALMASPGAIGSTTASTGAFTTLTASSTVSGAGITALMASPGPIGSTIASTGAFTTLTASSTVSGAGIVALMASPGAIGFTTPGTGAFTTLSASSTISGTGFTNYLASPPTIGGTAANTGKFTVLTSTGGILVSGVTTGVSGTSLELSWDGTSGKMQAYDRTALGFKPLWLDGLNTTIALNGSQSFFLNGLGNIGLFGSTPYSWGASFRTLQVCTSGGIIYTNPGSNSGMIGIGTSLYNDGSWRNTGTFPTIKQEFINDTINWSVGASGTTNGLVNGTGTFTTVMQLSTYGLTLTGTPTVVSSMVLDMGGTTTGGVRFPILTSVQRAALSNIAGLMVYDNTLNKLQVNNGTAWGSVGGGATGGGTDDIFYENGQTVTTNYTLTTNKNAMSAGPITINNGITVTIPNGATWSVV